MMRFVKLDREFRGRDAVADVQERGAAPHMTCLAIAADDFAAGAGFGFQRSVRIDRKAAWRRIQRSLATAAGQRQAGHNQPDGGQTVK